jgi:hypothetical protein
MASKLYGTNACILNHIPHTPTDAPGDTSQLAQQLDFYLKMKQDFKET